MFLRLDPCKQVQACKPLRALLCKLYFTTFLNNREKAQIKITKYHWSIENYSKTRYKRDIIFGIEDLLTSLGGTAGFFLGSSLMSGVELIYFFTLRLIR